jgi:SAM-dependent methyltransferase
MGPDSRIDRSSGRALFGADPSLYERARPDYPEEVFDLLAERCGLAEGTRLFEVGAGTGQATLRLARAGARITAIEPDPRLAARLAERVEGSGSEVTIEVAPFEGVSLPTGAFDLGAAATSFHWVDAELGLAKVKRLLVSGGWWATWWNVFGNEAVPDPFQAATQPIMERLRRSPSKGSGGKSHALDSDARCAELREAGFVNVEVDVMHWTAHLDSTAVQALYSTFSSVSELPPVERSRVLDTIGEVAERQFGGQVERPFQTILYTSQRP